MMIPLNEMTDQELHSEIFNCDAFDQDEIASELFLELWRRYEGVKNLARVEE